MAFKKLQVYCICLKIWGENVSKVYSITLQARYSTCNMGMKWMAMDVREAHAASLH